MMNRRLTEPPWRHAGGIDFDELDALIGDDGTSDDIATSAATDTDIGG